jgi:formamidopyrimidine-DNA glycosylase
MKDETVGQTLQRLAKESLPRHEMNKDRNSERRCMCGEFLPAYPKTRQKQLVCDDCAAAIPRETSGRRPNHFCFGCHAITPRLKMKMKNRELYCKKCLKIKFNIDF